MSADGGTVWYISKYLAPPADVGVGSRGYYLMRELARRGHRTVVITSDANHLTRPPRVTGAHLRQNLDGLDLYWVRTMKYRSVRSIRRILSWLHFDIGVLRLARHLEAKPDVIVASSLSLTTVLTAMILRRRFRARLIFEVRDIWPLTLTEEGGFSPRNPLVSALALVERVGYSKANAIVGTMPNLIAHVREVSNSQTPVYCVPMGYDVPDDPASELPAEYRDANVPTDRFLVGYAGSIGATNAMETLFESAARLASDPRMHFVIVGGGDLLDQFIKKYGNLPNVTFVGRVPRTSIAAVLRQFDVLYLSAFPSKVWDYGQSLNKLIDYMLAEKPVIASYSGFPSMLDEAGSGSFIPAGDVEALTTEITKYYALGHDVRVEMGRRGREWSRSEGVNN